MRNIPRGDLWFLGWTLILAIAFPSCSPRRVSLKTSKPLKRDCMNDKSVVLPWTLGRHWKQPFPVGLGCHLKSINIGHLQRMSSDSGSSGMTVLPLDIWTFWAIFHLENEPLCGCLTVLALNSHTNWFKAFPACARLGELQNVAWLVQSLALH